MIKSTGTREGDEKLLIEIDRFDRVEKMSLIVNAKVFASYNEQFEWY